MNLPKGLKFSTNSTLDVAVALAKAPGFVGWFSSFHFGKHGY